MGYLTFKERMTIPTYDDPEHMQTGVLLFDENKCKQCGICISLCPGAGILSKTYTKMDIMKGAKGDKCGLPYLDTIKPGITMCVACFDCGTACPTGAISIKNNFNPGYFYKRLTQTSDLRYPRKY